MAAAVLDTAAAESIDLLQTVHQQASAASSPAHHLSATVSTAPRPPLSNRLGKQRARLIVPPTPVAARYDDDDDDDELELSIERATTHHRRCRCQCDTRPPAVRHRCDVTVTRGDVTVGCGDVGVEDGRGRRRSSQDDYDSDAAVSCVERDRLTTAGLYLPSLLATSRSGVRCGAGDDDARVSEMSTSRCRQRRACSLSRCWTRLLCRDARRRHVDHDADDADDDCWRLFHGGRTTMSRDAGARVVAAGVGPRGDAVSRDAAPLTQCCCRQAGGKSAGRLHGRAACTQVTCVIVSGLCVALAVLVVGALVVYSE